MTASQDRPFYPANTGSGRINGSSVVVMAQETACDSSTGPLGAKNEVLR